MDVFEGEDWKNKIGLKNKLIISIVLGFINFVWWSTFYFINKEKTKCSFQRRTKHEELS